MSSNVTSIYIVIKSLLGLYCVEMEAKPSKSLDGTIVNQKKKWATRCVSHVIGVSAPTSVAVKQMRLFEDFSNPDDSGLVISRSLSIIYLNYNKSGMPKRLMFYKNGEWLDYPDYVVDLVKRDFKIKKVNVKVQLDGQEVVLNFLHMYHVDLKTGLQQPIDWIDQKGKCFFPEEPSNISEMKEPDVDLDAYTESIYGKLDVDSVKEMFLTGMTVVGITESDIVDIFHNSSMSTKRRLELFRKHADITKEVQGDANFRYAWLACSTEELSKMTEYGLRHYGLSPSKGIYGFGVHLTAVTQPYAWLVFI
jgi:hypothetical protein